MKIFISWSGERSRKVAELFDDWIQCVIQNVTPWMSSKDIDRGALWFTELNDQLSDTSIGVVFLTKDNKNKPWILFESGALAKGLTSNRVCTFLIDVQASDLENPLAQFNHTFPRKDNVWHLVRTINDSLNGSTLKESVLLKVFETYWPQFEKEFNIILSSTSETEINITRNDTEILLDVLSTVRSLDKRIRNVETSIGKGTFVGNNNLKKDYIMPSAMRMRIKNMLESEISEDEIIEHLTDGFMYSDIIVKREIDKVKKIMENQKESDGA